MCTFCPLQSSGTSASTLQSWYTWLILCRAQRLHICTHVPAPSLLSGAQAHLWCSFCVAHFIWHPACKTCQDANRLCADTLQELSKQACSPAGCTAYAADCTAHVLRPALLDISPLLQDAAAAIVDDSFLRCFQGVSSDPWNWNLYLFPLWSLGLILRYLILFPLR